MPNTTTIGRHNNDITLPSSYTGGNDTMWTCEHDVLCHSFCSTRLQAFVLFINGIFKDTVSSLDYTVSVYSAKW
jgi:hypothetical protein